MTCLPTGRDDVRLTGLPMQTPPDVLNLLDTGLVRWKGGKPQGLIEPPSIQGTKTIAEIVAEDRR